VSRWLSAQFNANKKDPLLEPIAAFFDQPKNVYGFEIKRDKVIHISWMSGKRIFDHKPSQQETTALLNAVSSYIESQHGAIQADPILNVRLIDDQSYELMVAYPTDRNLQPNADFSVKNMIPGFLMVGEVHGGPKTIECAEQNLEFFMREHKLQSPAIPFQTLITDRSKITDTAQWITRLNYPVFN